MSVRIALLGEAWGRQEAEANRPFVGATGDLLNRLCDEAGMLPQGAARDLSRALWSKQYDRRDRIYAEAGIRLTNVFNFQPRGNRIEDICGPRWGDLPAIRPGKYLRPEFTGELDRLRRELAAWKPNLIVGLGATAMWFAIGTGAITKRRGAVTSSPYGKFLPTFHPASLLPGRQPDQRPVVVADLIKATRESAYPEVRRPCRTIYIPDDLLDIKEAYDQIERSQMISIDIETAANQITCIGFAWSPVQTLVLPIFDSSKPNQSYWATLHEEMIVWDFIRQICALPQPKVFQNGLYDMNFLWRQYGITVTNPLHDTMLLHHALNPESKKGLGFLGSLYTDEPSWKLMRPRGKGTVKDDREE